MKSIVRASERLLPVDVPDELGVGPEEAEDMIVGPEVEIRPTGLRLIRQLLHPTVTGCFNYVFPH